MGHWSGMLPEDVLLVHVFPRLPIETRLALGVPPGRLGTASYAAALTHVFDDKYVRFKRGKGAYCVGCGDTYQGAGWFGHLPCMKRLHEHGMPPDLVALSHAVMGDQQECVRWILSVCTPDEPYACERAAINGNVGMIELLRGAGYPWGSDIWRSASGHPEMFAWLAANGCPQAMQSAT